jgi:putative transposase
MPDYRRYRVPGGTYFFTINWLARRADLLTRHIESLRETSVACAARTKSFVRMAHTTIYQLDTAC